MKLSWLKLFKSETQDLQKAPLETGGINFSGRHLNDYANQDIKYGANIQTHSLGIQPEKSIDVYGHQVNSPAGNKELFHHIISKDTTTHHKLSLSPNPEDRGVAGLMVEHYKDFPDWKGVPTVKLSHTDEPGFGFGSSLYKEALKHHGKLQSDSMTSPSANKTWDKIISSPDVTGEKGTIGAAESRHMAEYTPRKLAASELEKGLKGDWQKEGYRLDHWQDRQGYHNVAAYDKNNNVVGTASFTDHLVPNKLGTNLVSHPNYMKGWGVEVHPDHQRLGLASAMYQYAEKMSGKKILQGGTTPEGSSLWGQKDRKFGNLNIHDKINLKTLQRSEDGNLKKAPIEYTTDPQETHKKIPKLNETYPIINKVNLPNGLVYQQHMKSDFMGPVHVHHLYHPNSDRPVAEVITRPDEDSPMNHKVQYSQVSPDHKGKGLGKQAYLAALVHGKGIGRMLSDNQLSRNAHRMWTSLKGIPGLGGKIGRYVTAKQGEQSPAIAGMGYEDQHQVFVKNKKGLDHNAMFPAVDMGSKVKETKLAASEENDLKKAPMPFFPSDEGSFKRGKVEDLLYEPFNYGQKVEIEKNLPNGLIYRRVKVSHGYPGSGAYFHLIYHPNVKYPLAGMETFKNGDTHQIAKSKVHPKYRGRGIGKSLYAAVAMHGTEDLPLKSGKEVSPQAHRTWQSFKGMKGFHGRIAPYPKNPVRGEEYPDFDEPHHITVNPSEIESEKVFKPLEIKERKYIEPSKPRKKDDPQLSFDFNEPKKLAASEDLNKSRTFKTGVSGVSPNIGLERLKQIKQDHYVGAGGKDYDPDELHQRMFEISEKQAAKQSLFPEQESEKTHGSFEQMAPPMPGKKMFGKSDLIPPMIEKSETLEKAIHSKDFKPIQTSHSKGLNEGIDHAAQIDDHPVHASYEEHISKGPTPYKARKLPRDSSSGIATKTIHDLTHYINPEGHKINMYTSPTFMTKPYHGHLESATKNYTKHKIKGWATLATKDLLHAAGMGHMAEDVRGHIHEGVPVTVHKFSDNHEPLVNDEQQIHPLDAQKIAVMDFLTGNNDRHVGNIMVSKQKNENGYYDPLLIDHERNFQYERPISNKFGKLEHGHTDSPANTLLNSTGLNKVSYQHSPNTMMENTEDLHSWWHENGPKVREAFNKNINHIKDPHLKSHIENNFNQRMAHLEDSLIDGNYYDMFRYKAKNPNTYSGMKHEKTGLIDGVKVMPFKKPRGSE